MRLAAKQRLQQCLIATVGPVFANLRHHRGMSRFTLRGPSKVSTQWQLYCLVHNVEKIADRAGWPTGCSARKAVLPTGSKFP